MARIRVPLNNFSFGEISPSLTSRTDSQVYQNAAESVKNFFIRAEGGVIKRPASKHLYAFADTHSTTLTQQIRLEPFIFSDDEKYLIAFRNGKIDAFFIHPTTGVVSFSATVDFSEVTDARINQITFTQAGDFMFLCHADFFPVILKRTGLNSFARQAFAFDTSLDGNRTFQPYYNFQGNGVTLTTSASSGDGRTLTTSSAYFVAGMVGTRLLVGETEIIITAVGSTTSATGNIQGTIRKQLDFDALETKDDSNKVEVIHPLHGLAANAAITIAEAGTVGGISQSNINGSRTISRVIDENRYEFTAGASATGGAIGGGSPTIESAAATTQWFEQAYSTYRGFPAAITFHENRLWFGGTASQPDGIWASKTGLYFDFDTDDGSDTDAIDLDATAGVTNQIRHLVSNRDLQVFASQGEFFIPSSTTSPLTPGNAKVSAQTPFGTGFVRPQSIDGATLFVQSTGSAVREFVFSDSEGAYVGGQVSLLSSHLVRDPKQLAVVKGSLDRSGAYGFFLNNDGKISVYYSIRAEKRLGWMNWETDGTVVSIASTDNALFAVVSRDQGDGTIKLFLEQFDTAFHLDSGTNLSGTAGVFTKPAHLVNGAVVDVIDGTEYLGQFTIAGNQIDVSAVKASTAIEVGFKFTPELKTLPIDAAVQGGPLTARRRKLSLVDLDLNETLSVSVNGTNMIVRNVNFDPSQPREKQTGKKEFRPLGYSKDPRVTISQSAPLDLQINGLVIEVAF